MPVRIDHQKARRHIAELALDIIARDGMAALTTRHIAEVAGTSRGLVATYFADMRDLTLTAIGLMVERQVAMLEEAQAHGKGVRGCVEALLPMDEERLNQWRVIIAFYGLALTDPELAAFQQERIDGATRRFTRLLREERGLTKETAALRAEAEALVSRLLGVSIHHVFHESAQNSARQRKALVDKVMAGEGSAHSPA